MSTSRPVKFELTNRIKDLEDRVNALEGLSPDAVTILDDNGTVRVVIGLQENGGYDVQVYDASGNPV